MLNTPRVLYVPSVGGARTYLEGDILTADEAEAVVIRRIIRKQRVSLPMPIPAIIGHSRPIGVSLH